MGTSNFYYKNASRVYAICMSRECDVLDEDGNETGETEYRSPESYECEDTLEFIRESILESGGDYYNWAKSRSSLRSYEGGYLGSLRSIKQYGDINIEMYVHAFYRIGYYEGACLDWELEIMVDGIECDDDIDWAHDMVYDGRYSSMSSGLKAMLAKKAENWMRSESDRLSDAMEKVFDETSEVKMRKVATFSNGETIYEKIES